ncbi:hypothetical protein VNO78_30386 [Psophocarpus tetragonolobus]|uniref:Uncharacterized protein n=1 Tax=Psophocarpus tetragonolobus TaxID=3891 RepID=A0AAN9RWH8_PSOTE
MYEVKDHETLSSNSKHILEVTVAGLSNGFLYSLVCSLFLSGYEKCHSLSGTGIRISPTQAASPTTLSKSETLTQSISTMRVVSLQESLPPINSFPRFFTL